MVLLGSSANHNLDQVKKMVDEPVEDKVKGLAGGQGGLVDVREVILGKTDDGKEDISEEDEKKGFVSAQLVATSPHTMDKTMLQLNLKKPKVGEKAKTEIISDNLLSLSVHNGEVQGSGPLHQGH